MMCGITFYTTTMNGFSVRHRYEIPAGASKTAGGNENGAQGDGEVEMTRMYIHR